VTLSGTEARDFLPYGRQTIEDDDVAAVSEALRSGWLTTGPAVQGFEDALSARVGARFTVACSNGTAALHLAALALDMAPGDRVVVPSLTFLATANGPHHAGAEIIFADVDPETGLMGPDDLAAAFARADASEGGPVRAAFPVHMNGQCGDLDAIERLCAERDVAVVYDAAHALGTTYRTGGANDERSVGDSRQGTMSAFSFHPVKAIAMGEGGAVTTGDEEIAARLRRLRNHGMSRDASDFQNRNLAFDAAGEPNPWYYEMTAPGFNYRVSDINCALAISQLSKLDRFVARRRALAERYDRLIEELAPMVVPVGRVASCEPAWHLYVVLIDFAAAGTDRAAVMRALNQRGIGTMVHYLPVHLQPYYRDRYGPLDLPGARKYYERALSLPLFPTMADEDIDRVVDALTDVLEMKAS